MGPNGFSSLKEAMSWQDRSMLVQLATEDRGTPAAGDGFKMEPPFIGGLFYFCWQFSRKTPTPFIGLLFLRLVFMGSHLLSEADHSMRALREDGVGTGLPSQKA